MTSTDAQKRASIKYAKGKLKRIPLDVYKEKYAEIENHAKSRGESVNGFIKRAIDETMQRDKE